MQRYFVELTIRDTDHVDRDRVRQALEAALKHSTAREALDEALFSALQDECTGRSHEDGASPDRDEPTHQDAMQQDRGPSIGKLRLVPSQPDRDSGYVLYDFDMDELATTSVYASYADAADDTVRLDNVIVVPLVFEEVTVGAADPSSKQTDSYDLAIDGPTFRSQRELLLKLHGFAAGRTSNVPDPGDRELLEGLIDLTDAIADQAADRYGIESLL